MDTHNALAAATAPCAGRTGAPRAPIPIQVLLLDVGGVLVRLADATAVAPLERELTLPPGGLSALLYECEPWHALSTGRLDEDEYWRCIATQTGREPAALQRLLRQVWEPRPLRLDEGVVALAHAAHERVRVAILSNNTLGLEEGLRACGVDALFDPIINSARVGLRKPDPRFFLHALEVLDVPPGAVLFVDDKQRNTDAAEKLGICSVRFESAVGLCADLARYGVLPPAESVPHPP